MTTKVYKKAAIFLFFAAAVSAIFEWKRWPVSIIIGGVLGLTNLKALSWGVEGMLGTYKASGRLMFFSMMRLFILFMILLGLLMVKLINVMGALIGFTIVFIVMMKEAFIQAQKDSESS